MMDGTKEKAAGGQYSHGIELESEEGRWNEAIINRIRTWFV